jgi:predicted nucleotidyltransferase
MMTEITSLCLDEPLFLAERHRRELLRILAGYVPEQDVWAFGSRATGKHLGRVSDLDLAVERAVTPSARYDLKEALDESTLPIRVDFVELERVDPAFAERIRPDFVLVRKGDGASAGEAGPSAMPQDDKLSGGTAD